MLSLTALHINAQFTLLDMTQQDSFVAMGWVV